jgi:hypothetical protein
MVLVRASGQVKAIPAVRICGGIGVFERRPSTELGAVRREVDRIERRRATNEQAIELGAAECHIRDHFGNEDFADQSTVEVVAMDALGAARPNATIPIDAKTVEQACGRLREDLAARQFGPVRIDLKTANVARTVLLVGRAGVGDIEVFLVRREGDAVRANHIGDDRGDRAGFGVDSMYMAALDLLLSAIPFVVGVDAIGGVGEPDGVVRLHHDVVRRIETFAVPLFRNDGNRAVNLGAGHAAREMFACDQPALIVDGVAVRIVGALAEDGDFARGFDVPHHAIVRYVGPDEIAARREPGRTFSPARPRPQALDTHMRREASLEARIENDDVRSLDLTIPHPNTRPLWITLAAPCPGAPVECRSPRNGVLIPHRNTTYPPRVPCGIAKSAMLQLLDLISIAAFSFDLCASHLACDAGRCTGSLIPDS